MSSSSKDLPKVVLREKSTFVVSSQIDKFNPESGSSERLYSNQNPAKYVFDTWGDYAHAEFDGKLVIFKVA